MKKGFTLIELLVVISLIALFSSVTLAAVGTVRAKAILTSKIQKTDQLLLALEQYYLDNNDYPPVNTASKNGIMNSADFVDYFPKKYIPSIDASTIIIYVHTCSDTTPCAGGGFDTNSTIFSTFCGGATSYAVAILLTFVGPAPRYTYYAPTLSTVCLKK